MSDFNCKIPFLGAILNYIYDFCTYKRKWNLRVFFEGRMVKDNKYYFSLRCVNKTSYNIQITTVYIKESKASLRIQRFNGYENGIAINEYKYIENAKLTEEYTNIYLSPTDTSDYINGVFSNEARIQIEFQGIKTELFIEYKIKDTNLSRFRSIFFNNMRVIKVVIPI